MIMYDQEPDIVRWGLQLFDGNPYSDSGYCGSLSPSIPEYYDGQYYKDNSYGLENSNAQNDEILVHSIQQDLSQFSVAELNCSSEGTGNLQASDFPQEWLCQSTGDYNCVHEDVNDMVHSSSCSSIEDASYGGEGWGYSLDMTDEHSSDWEVGKRLNQMASVPHVPKINGEIPSIDEATLDHQRLLDRLQLYDLIEHKVQGDGNCQFRALSDQFYRTPEHHEFVRQQVVEQLKSCPEVYEGYVPMAYDEYIEKMSSSGQWGDHVTLQAAADSYGVKIFVITSFKDTCYIEIIPNVQRSNRVVCLSFWAEVHYNSIYPEGDVPEFETKKKKRWRLFGNKRCQTHGEPTCQGVHGESLNDI